MIYIRAIGERWNLISAAIRLETKSWCSHVELVKTNDSNDVIDVMACRWPGGLQHYPYITKGVTKEIWFDTPNLELVWKWMENHIGQKYDLSAIFGIAMDSNFHDDNRDICSECLMRGCEWAIKQPTCQSTVPWLMRTNVWRVSPAMVIMSPLLREVRVVK